MSKLSKQFKKFTISVLLLALLLLPNSFCLNLAAQEEAASPFYEVAPSAEYLAYLENPAAFGGSAPRRFSFADFPLTALPARPIRAVLPTRYDVRDYISVNSPKNQGTDSTCSFFAVLGNLELTASRLYNTKLDLSEQHARYGIAAKFSNGTNIFGFDREPAEGAHLNWISAYLINGVGPVNEVQAPYQSGKALKPKAFVNDIKPQIHTTELQTLPELGRDATAEQTAQWLEKLKSMIMEYGSVSITISMDGRDSTNTYFYTELMPEYHDHAVTAIGWDDSIPAASFTNTRGFAPTVNGGILFKNSWGTAYGENGYGYLSYGQTALALQDAQTVTALRSASQDEQVNTYSELGMRSALAADDTEPKWFGNKFYLAAGEQVSLKEISFYALLGNMNYEVYLSPTGSTAKGSLVQVGAGKTQKQGYYTVPIEDITLGGEAETAYFAAVKVYPDSTAPVVPTEGTTASVSDGNVVSTYISYRENGIRRVIQYNLENMEMLIAKGLSTSYTVVDTGFAATDSGAFVKSTANIVLSTVTVPYTEEVVPPPEPPETPDPPETQPLSLSAVCSANTVTLSAEGGEGDNVYCLYLLKEGKIYYKRVYTEEAAFTLETLPSGSYTYLTYVQDSSHARVRFQDEINIE
ncbi:MAG: lectin like domain-containing protein [Oscillospiraceae bacterium]|jgi:C1A family cysteine protease|nr:lectin like domain-containing protein [Oscillospiraceae bacterium]